MTAATIAVLKTVASKIEDLFAAHKLNFLNDRMLADIGLSRADLVHLA